MMQMQEKSLECICTNHVVFFFFFFDRKRQRDILIKKEVQEKDEESSHQRKTKLQGNKYKKIQSKNKQTL